MTPEEYQREVDLLAVVERVTDWRDGAIAAGINEGTIDELAKNLYEYVEKLYDAGYTGVEGVDMMDGLQDKYPKLHWFSLGFFGSHDFVWMIKGEETK